MTHPVDTTRISFPRLRARLDALAQIGSFTPGGCSRLALTDADRDGRDLVVTWMQDLGLRVDIDGIGNIVGTWPADRFDPAVLTGSHIDTVATGGIYDGALGVLAGLEVIETVVTAGIETERPLAVGVFTDEEGSRFAPDMLGSLVFVGGLALETALDVQGVDGAVLGDELARIGYAGPSPCPAVAPHAFVELHIEQGPVLEVEDVAIGVVTGVQGISWTELTITGQSNHAGTTPMALRHDAAYVAAAIAVALRELTQELGPPLVATVGRVELHPNLVNVVAARAVVTVDLRHTDDAALTDAELRLVQLCDAIAASEEVTIQARSLARFSPVEFDHQVIDRVEAAARAQGHSTRRMPSGAGHDAQMLARVCPAGMVFVPSAGGVSHNPAEHTDDDQLAAGADVLLQVMLELAGAR
ncbi:MAG: beta-ureidopropionase / N-carbamoyl-L-amino-acid hydrolase [Actinomycetota bacterium]|nr:beta-ureidopropionase / N-carbamoyl-L-amino-acid hydrolase [Actinomycetota bacterium]